jgi:outer membrane protein W
MESKMKRKTLLIGLMAWLISGFNSSGFAQDYKTFGVGGFAGFYNNSSSTFVDADASFETVPVFGGVVTYYFSPKYSIELWATQYSSDMDLSFDDKEAKLGELDQTPILLTGRFQFPIRKSNSVIYLGAGIGYSFNDFEQVNRSELEDFFAVNLETEQIKDSVLWALNAGAEMRLQENYALFGDLKIIFSEPDFDVIFNDGSTASKSVGMNASVLSFGFKYYF